MNAVTKISIFGKEVEKIKDVLTSRTAAIIFLDTQNPLYVDYDELAKLDEEALEKLIRSSIPGSRLRKEAAHQCIKKILEYKDIKEGSTSANMVFYRVEQMVTDDAVTKKFVMELRWKYLGLI